jgi:hypothetical protein
VPQPDQAKAEPVAAKEARMRAERIMSWKILFLDMENSVIN